MATLIDTIQPTVEYLEGILPQALSGKSEEAWTAQYLENLAARLMENPAQYRSFGPWWPQVKEQLITAGYKNFGILNDIAVAAIYKMPRPALTLVAAHLYSDWRIDNGHVYTASHLLEVNEAADDTEPYNWESFDEEVENDIQRQSALR